MNIDWKGIFPAVTTKFTAGGELDLQAFEFHLEKQIAAGVHGLIVGGSLGEASTLRVHEKQQLLRKAVEVADGRLPVLMNIAEGATEEAIARARQAEDHGASGLMLLPPMRYRSDARETLVFFKDVANATALPVMIYNNPVDYGVEVTLDMFETLADTPNIQAVKESTRDVTNVVRMRNRFADRFSILCGVDTLAFEELVNGADGWVAGLVNAFPEETVLLYELIQKQRFDEAKHLYRWFMPLLELDIHPKLVQYIKLAEVEAGIGTEHVRAPRLPLEGDERAGILNIIHKALKQRPDLSTYQKQAYGAV